MTEVAIELRTPPRRDSRARSGSKDEDLIIADESALARQEFSLPPVDRGKDALLFLAASFTIEALVWGFPFAFGVFQKYYTTHEPFAGSDSIAIIGTCSMGVMYLAVPFVIPLLRLFPGYARWAPIIGLLFMCIAIAMSSFSTTVTQLIATQGILYAIGGCVAYCPCILWMDEWFVSRKGFAYGIMWSGTGLAGVILPLFLEAVLDRYGFRTALRVWSGVLFAVTAPLAVFIRPRLPVAAAARGRRPNLRFALSRPFALHQLANVVEATGFFLPGIYLPLFAQSALGASPFPCALTVLLLNVASVFGCVAMGHLTDRLHVTTCIMLSTAGATIGAFLFWGFSTSLPVLYAFCVVYGLFAGCYTTAWTGIMKEMVKMQEAAGNHGFDPISVIGMLSAGRGIGNVISGPLSEALLNGYPWKGQAAGAYGSGYGTLIVYTGVTALFGGAGFAFKRVGWM